MDLQQFLSPKIPVPRKHQYITVKSIRLCMATPVFVSPIANLHTTITTPNSPRVCNVSPVKLDAVARNLHNNN